MGWRALGDGAWLFEAAGADSTCRRRRVLALGRRLEEASIPQVTDVVAAFETLAVHFAPPDGPLVLDWLTRLTHPHAGAFPVNAGKIVEIPVVYGDRDSTGLAAAAEILGMSAGELIERHCAAEYTVAAVGFAPGFPYLTGLDPRLHLPRRSRPGRVPAGAVAIAGDQAGIYPCASHGGWHVLGRTGFPLFDPSRQARPSILEPGDRIRFQPVSKLPSPLSAGADNNKPSGRYAIEMIEPGIFSSVQDLGRTGYQRHGVSAGGALDPVAAVVANRLVGNPDHAAVIECAAAGPILHFHRPARVAWVGWLDPRGGCPHAVAAGDRLDLRGRMSSAVGYIAVAGGIDVPLVLGSRSTDARGGFGGHRGRRLISGDRLRIGDEATGGVPRAGNWHAAWPRAWTGGRPLEIRFIRGMQTDWFGTAARITFGSAIYRKSAAADRTGMRMDGPHLPRVESREMVSQPVVRGSIQVPPDGSPIVLLAECQTIGGYPQIGHVITADLPDLARAQPGTPVRFREVAPDEAITAWRSLRRDLGMLGNALRLQS